MVMIIIISRQGTAAMVGTLTDEDTARMRCAMPCNVSSLGSQAIMQLGEFAGLFQTCRRRCLHRWPQQAAAVPTPAQEWPFAASDARPSTEVAATGPTATPKRQTPGLIAAPSRFR